MTSIFFVIFNGYEMLGSFMADCILVGLGGFVGTVLRYLIGLLPVKAESGFPVKTLMINVIGSFVIGAIAILAAKNKSLDPRLVLVIKVGVCGGFTTFSAFAYETADLMQRGNIGVAICYVVLSVVLGVTAIFGAQLLLR
jgi:CrcB protein